jgi:hypothetical protein
MIVFEVNQYYVDLQVYHSMLGETQERQSVNISIDLSESRSGGSSYCIGCSGPARLGFFAFGSFTASLSTPCATCPIQGRWPLLGSTRLSCLQLSSNHDHPETTVFVPVPAPERFRQPGRTIVCHCPN